MRLLIATTTPDDFEGRIDIAIDGSPLASFVPGPGAQRRTIDLVIPPSALADGLLDLALEGRRYGRTPECGERKDISISLQPDSALQILLPPGLDAPARLSLLPQSFTARVPPGPASPELLRNITLMAARLTRKGHRISFTQSAHAAAAVTFAPPGGRLSLLADGTLRIPATHVAANRAYADDMPEWPWPRGKDNLVPLAALGVSTEARQADPQAEWNFMLPLRSIPADLAPIALEVDVTAPLDPEGARQNLALYINGQLVASELLQLKRDTRHVLLPIPRGALNATNAMRLVFTRSGVDRICGHATSPLPVSLGLDSLIVLGPAPRDVKQFFEFARLDEPAATLWIAPELLNEPARILPFAVALTASTLRDTTPLKIAAIGEYPRPGDQPFLYLAAAAPFEGLERPVQAGSDTLSFAQLIAGPAAPGIWLHPAANGTGAALIALDRGDVALFQADGATRWFNSRPASRQTVFSSQSEPLRRLLKRYWPWTAGILWLCLTAATLIALARRRADPP